MNPNQPTISLSELKKNAAKQIEEQDAYFQSIGFVRQGNKYVRNPAYQNPADAYQQGLQIQKLEQDVTQSQQNTDPLLSVNDAAALGVPYGTTQGQAAKQGIKPQSSQNKPTELQLAYTSLRELIPQVKFNEKGDLPGVGALGSGAAESFLYNLGLLKGDQSDQGETNRIAISQIQGTLAKLRGGASFTPNEERLLKRYTPDINDSPQRIKQKLKGLETYLGVIAQKYSGFLGSDTNTGTSGATQQSAPSGAESLRSKYGY